MCFNLPEHTPESLLPLLNEVDKLHERFIRYKRCVPEHSDLWRVTREKLRALWTYHSNAIEGLNMPHTFIYQIDNELQKIWIEIYTDSKKIIY